MTDEVFEKALIEVDAGPHEGQAFNMNIAADDETLILLYRKEKIKYQLKKKYWNL